MHTQNGARLVLGADGAELDDACLRLVQVVNATPAAPTVGR
ncbi:hypothetical protein [Ornithinimicrobium cerasi]|nr:hypothetical protein [Ornithinimicrobium cerasi]